MPFALYQGKQSVTLLATLKYTEEGNKMKKLLIVLVTVVSVGLSGSVALACYWDGYWGEPMRGPMMGGPMMGGYYSGMNQGGTYQNFLNDTVALRQELAAKQGEYNALMTQPNPDPKRAGELSREMVGIHDRLQAKAQASGLPAPGAYGAPMGGGYGHGYGRGYSGWACW